MMENKNQRFFKFDYIKPSFIFIYKNMAVRTALLTSRNITLDTDFSKYIESITTPWMIKGKEFTVTASSVSAGTAFVPCTRTNEETIYALVQNFSPVSISGNGYVIIKVDDTIVDNGGGNEDGTGIATIEVVDTLPSKNYLHLATITNGTVTMVAPTIKKLNELDTQIQSIFTQLADLDERVEHLEEADAIDHLEESGLVWELYTLEDNLFKQYAPTLANSTLEANVGDLEANTEIHIQAMGSGVASNQLKLKVKMAWAPTTSLKVEVRKGIQVTVTENVEAYWYGDSNNIYATGTLASSSFSSNWAEVTFTLDNAVGGTKWELLDVVVYQTTGSGATVNASNYYVLACDSTQYSEGFSYVSVNGSTRARSKLMPYLSSDGFVQAMLSKVKEDRYKTTTIATKGSGSVPPSTSGFYLFDTAPSGSGSYIIRATLKQNESNWNWYAYWYKNNVLQNQQLVPKWEYKELSYIIKYTSSDSGNLKLSLYGTTGYIYYESGAVEKIIATLLGYKWLSGEPTLLSDIWELATINIFWIDKTWIFKGGVLQEKSNEATTGNITLGNAKGYIKVLFNGEYIKIPYYGN